MADLTMKRFDTYPPIYVTLSDTNGVIPLTNASSVTMIMKAAAGGTILRASCAVASALGGYARHDWLQTETNQADSWSLEWEILWNTASGVQTVPNSAVLTLLVTADLENS